MNLISKQFINSIKFISSTLEHIIQQHHRQEQHMQEQQQGKNKNLCIIVIGMSGTGKTTFVNKFSQTFENVHCINLDPAVKFVPYKPFLDIRVTHDYKKVMNEYKLGPNGAILTALNLYTAQPEHIIAAIAKKSAQHKGPSIFLIDIPGQIQVFTWSASSIILTQSIATMMPVKILYLIDSVRCINPNTFLSNLLFAQSIKFRLNKFSFTVLLNKADAQDADKLIKQMKDYDLFLEELAKESNYMSTLSRSVVINMSDMFGKMDVTKVSAKTGFGFTQLRKILDLSVQ